MLTMIGLSLMKGNIEWHPSYMLLLEYRISTNNHYLCS